MEQSIAKDGNFRGSAAEFSGDGPAWVGAKVSSVLGDPAAHVCANQQSFGVPRRLGRHPEIETTIMSRPNGLRLCHATCGIASRGGPLTPETNGSKPALVLDGSPRKLSRGRRHLPRRF